MGKSEGLIPLSSAAAQLDLNVSRLRALCAEGRAGRKLGKYWYVTVSEIEKLREELARDPRSKFYKDGAA